MIAADQLKLIINIPLIKIKAIIKWIIIADIIFLCGTGLHHSKLLFQHKHTLDLLLREFNLGLENVAAAWYSSMLLFLVAAVGALCYLAERNQANKLWENIINIGWLFISLAFTLLSFDEMGSFHESIGDTAFFKKMTTGSISGWVVFYILGGGVAAFMGVFFLLKFKKNKRVLLFSIAGFLLLLSIPFQEKLEHYTWDNAEDRASWYRPVSLLLLEEGCELLGFLCFLISFAIYAVDTATKKNSGSTEKNLKVQVILKNNFLLCLFGTCILTGLLMSAIYFNAWHLKEDDLGRPQNWFPGISAFAVFLVSTYQFFKFKNKRDHPGFVYLSIAIVSFFTSIYFGADIYNYQNGLFTKVPGVILGLTILIGIRAIFKLSGIWAKLCIILWVTFIIFSIFTKDFFNPPFFGFIAFYFLLIALFFNSKFRSKILQDNIN